MTDTNTLAPTDEAIMAWAMSHQTDAIKVLRGSGFVRVARAVLAKWGAPTPAIQPVVVPARVQLDRDVVLSYARETFGDSAEEYGFYMGVRWAESQHGITAAPKGGQHGTE